MNSFTHKFWNLDEMNQILEITHTLSQLTQYEMDTVNSTVIINTIEYMIEKLPPKWGLQAQLVPLEKSSTQTLLENDEEGIFSN